MSAFLGQSYPYFVPSLPLYTFNFFLSPTTFNLLEFRISLSLWFLFCQNFRTFNKHVNIIMFSRVSVRKSSVLINHRLIIIRPLSSSSKSSSFGDESKNTEGNRLLKFLRSGVVVSAVAGSLSLGYWCWFSTPNVNSFVSFADRPRETWVGEDYNPDQLQRSISRKNRKFLFEGTN